MLSRYNNKNESKHKNLAKTIQEIIKVSSAKMALLVKGKMRTLRKKNKKLSNTKILSKYFLRKYFTY